MSVRGVDIKVGDRLRYLGGDESDYGQGTLTKDVCYLVVSADGERSNYVIIEDNYGGDWYVSKDGYNSDCFELVGSGCESGSDHDAEICKSCGEPKELEKAGKKYEFVCYDCETTVRDEYINDKALDLIARLAGRVAHIERRIRDIDNQVAINSRDIETWAQDIAELQARRELK